MSGLLACIYKPGLKRESCGFGLNSIRRIGPRITRLHIFPFLKNSVEQPRIAIQIYRLRKSEATPTRSHDPEGKNYWNLYSAVSLFYEFHNERSIIVNLFYLLFFVRRLVYACSQVFLNKYPIVQALLNVAHSICFTLYVLATRPFREPFMNWMNYVGEVAICFLFIGIFYNLCRTF